MTIRGAYPGGPTHPATLSEPGLTPFIPSVASLETYAAHRRLLRRRARRAARRIVGVSAVFAAALVIGGALGRASRVTPTEVASARQAQPSMDRLISREVNRTLLELWKMEDLESAGVGRRHR